MLNIINTIVIGMLFSIWSNEGLVNVILKLSFLVLLVVNILNIAGKL